MDTEGDCVYVLSAQLSDLAAGVRDAYGKLLTLNNFYNEVMVDYERQN